jgi:hypothetical protein
MKIVLAFLILIFTLFADDSRKVYQNNRDIKIEIFQNKTFKVTRFDGVVLRKPLKDEQYFVNSTNSAVKVLHQLVKKDGGVDILYVLYNPSDTLEDIPDFTVDGLNFNSKNSLNILNTLNFQYMHKRKFNEQNFKQHRYFDVAADAHVYPELYSPVIVAHDDNFAVGASLNFNYQKDELSPNMRIYQLQNGLWRYSFDDIVNRKLHPKEVLKLTLSIRFSKTKNWLFTLYPYKNHFNKLYDKTKNIVKKDTNIISGILLSYGSAAYENYLECQKKEIDCKTDNANISKYNLFGYNYYLRPDLFGLDGENNKFNNQKFITTYINKLKKAGYKRAMIWGITGQYWHCPEKKVSNNDGFIECTTNYPPQFMSAESYKVRQSIPNLKKFKKAGIDLGLWWGRAGQLPKPFIWNPDDVIPFNINNFGYIKFYQDQLKLAKAVDVKEIGLDAFSNMDTKSQLPWLIKMKKIAPNVKFYNEGSVCDFLHTQTSAFIQPQNPWVSHDKGPIKTKALLAQYLNPDAEIIVYYPESTPSKKELKRLINWGYTPLILSHPNIFEHQLLDINEL